MIHTLTAIYCLYNGSFYEQKDVAALGSPLNPVVASLYTENSKQLRTNTAIKTPTHWFILWLHGKEKLQDFLRHLNGIHQNIKFAMAIKKNGALPFWTSW
jgi:hypothetical protein